MKTTTYPTNPGLDEQARAAAATLSSEQLADVRQHFLRQMASLAAVNYTGRRREIQRKSLYFLADVAADTKTDAELAQYLVMAVLLSARAAAAGCETNRTIIGGTLAEHILTLSDITIRLPRRSHGEAKTGQS